MTKSGKNTLAVHAGRSDFSRLGVHAPPLSLSTTYPIKNLEKAIDSIDQFIDGKASAANPVYARLFNPTVARWEAAIAEIENAEASVAFSSGMAAFTAVLLASKTRGDHIVAVRPLYGGSDHLLSSGLLGTDVTWANPDHISEAIGERTALVVLETPANPSLHLVDISSIVEQAGDVPVLVDSTFATPILQNPLQYGAQYVLHSATKFLGGHGDVMAGVVATSETHAAMLRQVRIATGAVLNPFSAYLLHRGLPTLPLRVHRAQETAIELASRLVNHPFIDRVFFPGHAECDPLNIVGRQMTGPGALVSFELGNANEVAPFLRSLELVTAAVSLGSTDTLIQYPAGLTHRIVDEASREQAGISSRLLRLSVGLEDVDDLWFDLKSALATARAIQNTKRPLQWADDSNTQVAGKQPGIRRCRLKLFPKKDSHC